MDHDFSIPSGDGKKVYFRINQPDDEARPGTIAVFVHGFTGSIEEHIYQEAAKAFPEHGIATCRIVLYNGRLEAARRIDECSLMENVHDVESVIEWLKGEGYRKVHLIGHSLGGIIAILASHEHVEKMVLWDPTTGFQTTEEKGFIWNECLSRYVSYRRIPVIISKYMIEQWKAWKADMLAERIDVPVKFIFATKYNKYNSWRQSLRLVRPEHEVAFIEAGHTFSEECASEKLMRETIGFLDGPARI